MFLLVFAPPSAAIASTAQVVALGRIHMFGVRFQGGIFALVDFFR